MKHVVITGANRGIGLELAKHYHGQGWRVTGVCRESCAELDGYAAQVIKDVDVAQPGGVERLAEALHGQEIDLLINNAGVLNNDVLGSVSLDSLRLQMEVNAFAPLMISQALQDNLPRGSKLIHITSRMGSIEDNDSGGYYGYRASKAALNAFGKSLAIDLKERGVAVALLHPGFVKTRMVNYGGMITTEESVAGLVERIDALTLENTGGFWHCNGEELPW